MLGIENCTLTNNIATKNQRYGLSLTAFSLAGEPPMGSTNNTLTKNRGQQNGVFDAFQDAASTGNTWNGNTFGKTSGIPLPF